MCPIWAVGRESAPWLGHRARTLAPFASSVFSVTFVIEEILCISTRVSTGVPRNPRILWYFSELLWYFRNLLSNVRAYYHNNDFFEFLQQK